MEARFSARPSKIEKMSKKFDRKFYCKQNVIDCSYIIIWFVFTMWFLLRL